jgi:hypothetical protein
MRLDLANDTLGVRLLVSLGDAERCLSIYSSIAASSRPLLAWDILPSGSSVSAAIMTLMATSSEHSAPADLYEDRLALLTIRAEQARAAWRAHFAIEEITSHVH